MTGRTTRAIAGFEPRIAMLSFSTKGSAKHEMVDKVVRAHERPSRWTRRSRSTANCRRCGHRSGHRGQQGAGQQDRRQGERARLPYPRGGQHRLQARAAHGACRGDRPDPAGNGRSDQRPFARMLGRRHRLAGSHYGLSGRGNGVICFLLDRQNLTHDYIKR